ncbi:GxxExxY protein [Cytophagaceae bacterium ABcell3]|nr:GxxExxY protein [Cytophagaceae bacterium ABcell3]
MKQVINYNELTHKIIGCSMQVHNQIGNGFQEVIYQRALEIEFSLNKIPYAREVEMPVFYKGHEIGTRRVDFLVQESILVELKSIIKLEDVHLAQAKNYLEAFKLPTGLLINFGSTRLEVKRLFNNKIKS